MMAICLADGQMLKRPSRDFCHAATPIGCNGCFPELRPEASSRLRAARLKAMLRECDSFIFPSEFLAERYIDWGLPGDRCAVIPNGQADLAAGEDRQHHSARLNRFGFFGQFLDNKGIDVLLEALIILAREKRVPAAGLVLEINGGNKHYASAAYHERVAGQIAEIGRLKVGPIEVRDRGGYGRDELATRMRMRRLGGGALDLVGGVRPRRVGSLDAFGRPVIASAIGGLAERVRDGVDGLTCPAARRHGAGRPHGGAGRRRGALAAAECRDPAGVERAGDARRACEVVGGVGAARRL